jgi:hypothetical protein
MARLDLSVIDGKDPFSRIVRNRYDLRYYSTVGLLTETGGVLISDFHCVSQIRLSILPHTKDCPAF